VVLRSCREFRKQRRVKSWRGTLLSHLLSPPLLPQHALQTGRARRTDQHTIGTMIDTPLGSLAPAFSTSPSLFTSPPYQSRLSSTVRLEGELERSKEVWMKGGAALEVG
jgi:hypothetical protein